MTQLDKLFEMLGAKGIKHSTNWEHKFLRFTLMHVTLLDAYENKNNTITVLFQVFEHGFLAYIEQGSNDLEKIVKEIQSKLDY